MPNDGELSLIVDGQRFLGWTEARITRGCERFPNDFEVALTERFPGEASMVLAKPGTACAVEIGGDRVITGCVDRYVPSISKRSHSVRIIGRGKGAALVDASPLMKDSGGQIRSSTTRAIVEKIAGEFGLSVVAKGGYGRVTEQFNLMLTETAWDAISRVVRNGQMLAYEGTDGNLILAEVGSESMSSGFREGENVESATATYAYDQRFSQYVAVYNPIETMKDVAAASGTGLNSNRRVTVTDEEITLYRPKVFVLEADKIDDDFATARMNWERNRRWGRSQAVAVTVDSWRDAAGRLWEPNTLAPVHIPSLKVRDKIWCISEVTYVRNSEGTHADLVLMPPEAFSPEPNQLLGFDFQLQQATASSNTTGVPGGGP